MAFNGSGTHIRVHNWATDLTNSVPVTASRMDAEHNDLSAALSTAICRDGQSTTIARIPFASGVSATAGSPSAVAYAQTNDTNTGLYFPATDQWGLAAGGTGTLTSTSAAVSVTGTLGVSSDLAINTNKFTVTAASGNTAIAGTLAVTGASTFAAAATPATNDAAALGSTSLMWSDLFLASGAVINWNNGDVTLTHSANALAFAGASSGYSFDAAVTVSSGGAAITGNSTVTGSLTVTNGLTVSGGSIDLPAGSVADADLALPGMMKLILKQTASSSATIDFTQSNAAAAFDGTYDRIVVLLSNVKAATDDVEVWMRIGTGGTPTYQTGASAYSWASNGEVQGGGHVSTGQANDSKIVMTRTVGGVDLGNATGEKFSATIEFDSPDASDLMPVKFRSHYIAASGVLAYFDGAGLYKSAGAITAIRFMMESGNIASGTFVMYGIKDA